MFIECVQALSVALLVGRVIEWIVDTFSEVQSTLRRGRWTTSNCVGATNELGGRSTCNGIRAP